MYPYGVPVPYYPGGKQPEPPPIPEQRKALARAAGATHLSRDGQTAYVRRMGCLDRADWLGNEFGSWWSSTAANIPEGAIEL